MQVLITGATGFIGSHLTEALHLKGYKLRVILRNTSNRRWIEHLPIEYIVGDLNDINFLNKAVEGVDYIYNLAGVTKARNEAEYFRSNHEATRNLLAATLLNNQGLKRFVQISSQTVSGPSKEGKPVDEETPCRPITTYGRSKLEAERECLKLTDKLPITIIRPPAVYGPRDKDIYEFFKTMNKGIHPMIGFSDTYISLIHVSDLVRGILLAGEHEKSVGGTFFISSERYYNWKEVGDITSKIMKKRAIRIRVPVVCVYGISVIAEIAAFFSRKPALLNIEKAKDLVQRAWTCNIEKARKELGYREELTIEDGIRDTVKWYRENGWL
jgi:nucleoside-diphosphate-sugar epimerase